MTTNSSDYVETEILNTYLRGYSFTSACTPYIALYTTGPTDSTNGVEVVGNSNTLYRRISASGTDYSTFYMEKSVIFVQSLSKTGESSLDGTEYPKPIPTKTFNVFNGSATNLFQIDFPPRGATTWGTVTHFAIVTGSWIGASGSHVLFYAPLETPYTLAADDVLSFPVDSINLSIHGNTTIHLANNILNYYLNKYYPNVPGLKVQIALFKTLPNRSEVGGVEVPTMIYSKSGSSPTGYARKQFSGATYWSTPATYNGTTSSSSTEDLLFINGALEDWGSVRGAGIYDGIRNKLLFIVPFVLKTAAEKNIGDSRFVKDILKEDSFKLGKGFFRVTID